MRVTENSNFDAVRDSIRRSKERMEGLQQQSSTLKKVNQPSDDPISATKILELRTDKVNNDQFQMNSKIAESFMSCTDNALSDLVELVLRAKDIALNQSSSASSNEQSRLGVAEEVTQLLKQAISVGNQKIGERYVFGGFKTQKPPIGPEGNYLGDDGQMMIEIGSGVFIPMNISGEEAFNTHPSNSVERKGYAAPVESDEPADQLQNVNLFEALQHFRIALISGDMEGIRDSLDHFDQIHSKLVATRAKVGSRMHGMGMTEQSIERHNITNAILSSSLEDADMTQVMSDLGKEETVFRSSLATSKRLIQPTLMDFLR